MTVTGCIPIRCSPQSGATGGVWAGAVAGAIDTVELAIGGGVVGTMCHTGTTSYSGGVQWRRAVHAAAEGACGALERNGASMMQTASQNGAVQVRYFLHARVCPQHSPNIMRSCTVHGAMRGLGLMTAWGRTCRGGLGHDD